MLDRCTNPNLEGYSRYGGRGIRVCEEWEKDVTAFYGHVSQLPHCGERGYSLDRIDNDGNYEPGNVRWATMQEQGRNRRTNHWLTFKGETKCILDWERSTGICRESIMRRLKAGWDIERILTTPTKRVSAGM